MALFINASLAHPRHRLNGKFTLQFTVDNRMIKYYSCSRYIMAGCVLGEERWHRKLVCSTNRAWNCGLGGGMTRNPFVLLISFFCHGEHTQKKRGSAPWNQNWILRAGTIKRRTIKTMRLQEIKKSDVLQLFAIEKPGAFDAGKKVGCNSFGKCWCECHP